MAEYAQRMLSWRMRHDERTLTGHLVTRDGLVVAATPEVERIADRRTVARHGHVSPAAIAMTPQAASTRPTSCMRWSRSPSTNRARTTVEAG